MMVQFFLELRSLTLKGLMLIMRSGGLGGVMMLFGSSIESMLMIAKGSDMIVISSGYSDKTGIKTLHGQQEKLLTIRNMHQPK